MRTPKRILLALARRHLRPRLRLGRGRAGRARRAAPEGGCATAKGRLMERWTRFVLRHRFVVLAAWVVVFVVAGAALVEALGPAHESLHAAGHRLAARGADPPGSLRAAVDGIVHARRRRATAATAATLLPQARRRPARGRRGAADREARLGPAAQRLRDRGPDRLASSSRPTRRGSTDAMREAAGSIPGAHALPHGPGGDRARSRPCLRRGPQEGRALPRDPDRARDPHLHVRDAVVPAAVRLRARDDPDDARDHLDLRELHGADDVPDRTSSP